jgi:membrane protein implicated in regulation of membrane protease activity
MEGHWIWWIAALAMLIAELFTGTFYLLVIAVALAAGGLVAYLDASFAAQFVTAGAVGFVGAMVLRKTRFGKTHSVDTARDANVNIDIGNRVVVNGWDGHGRARVAYRGAQWDVQLDASGDAQAAATNAQHQPGEHVIKEVRGTTLVVAPVGMVKH